MPKIDYKKLRNELFRRTERYANGVRRLYDQALADIAKEFANMDYDPSRVFSFEDVGKFGKVDAIMTRLESQIQQVVDKGIVAEFGQAYSGCDELIRRVVGKSMTAEVAKAFMPRVLSGNAAKVFIKANKAGNITASQRVWNGAALGQMETAVEEGLMEGMPASRMAKLLEDYLNDPDSCFRRFRIKTGVDADGKSMYGRKWKKRIIHEDGSTTWKDADPRDYPVGSGVYHSSYKNALRYARTTTNIAYRTADHDRYQDLPFVIGIEIKTSGNHPESDICDELAGEYPKDFLWVGWHPNCRCYQVPILAKPDEVNKMADAILEGEDPNNVPVEGRITDVPDNFKGWIERNTGRMSQAVSMPYFIRDNTAYVSNILGDTELAKNLIIKYGINRKTHFSSPIDGKFIVDISGGAITATIKGITSLINALYKAKINRERVEILKRIISDKNFEKLTYHSTKDHSIYAMGLNMFNKKLKKGEMPANLAIAKKMAANGFDVYLLPNPNSSVSADFILKKDGKLYYSEGKTLNGKNSLDHRLSDASKQSGFVVVDIIGTNDARYISDTVRTAFEQNRTLQKVILLKGGREINISRQTALSKHFSTKFRSIWNKNK